MKLLLVSVAALAAACAPAAPEPPAPPAPDRTQAAVGPGVYEGDYTLRFPDRVLTLRVWAGADGRLNGELVEMGQRTTFRPSTEHRFLHGTRDDVWFLFTVENGRATRVTMHHGGREISGPRNP